MARSMKTFAHALTLSTGNRIVSIATKPDHSLKMTVTAAGKSFVLTCGAEVHTVNCADHGGADSVRDIAEQLCDRLAARSGCKAPEMAISEGAARPRVALSLDGGGKSRK